MSAKKKGKKLIYKLVSDAKTGYFKVFRKNPKNPKKLEVRKYNPKTRQHEVFKEMKNK